MLRPKLSLTHGQNRQEQSLDRCDTNPQAVFDGKDHVREIASYNVANKIRDGCTKRNDAVRRFDDLSRFLGSDLTIINTDKSGIILRDNRLPEQCGCIWKVRCREQLFEIVM